MPDQRAAWERAAKRRISRVGCVVTGTRHFDAGVARQWPIVERSTKRQIGVYIKESANLQLEKYYGHRAAVNFTGRGL